MKYKRRWDCAECGKPLIYNTETCLLSCQCGDLSMKIGKVSLKNNFIEMGVKE